MTSFGTTGVDCMRTGFMPTFKIQGQAYHQIGSLLPLSGDEAKFLQIYFVGDEEEQTRIRRSHQPGIKADTVTSLQRMLHDSNKYVKTLKSTVDQMPTEEYRVKICANKTPRGEHARRYNAPVPNDVGIVIVGEEFKTRDIILHSRDDTVRRINELHRSYDALQYPLMFSTGEDGYCIDIPQTVPSTGDVVPMRVDAAGCIKPEKTVSANDFYAFRCMIRRDSFNTILKCGHLFHQYITDMYAKVEAERLNYIRFNQKRLRADEYIHLKDAVRGDNTRDLGQLIILPSSFTGGPRYMHERTQDAMTYVRCHGRPDLFITCTCNPKWIEIQRELMPGQSVYDRHDLLARVFHQKVKSQMNLIVKGRIFGRILCWMYTIEWQKRGLPHVHYLFWLANKIRPGQIDNIISAEIPNPETDPLLFQIVTKQLLHGPCGSVNPRSPCMENGKCQKNYPKLLSKDTQADNDGYPLYRRRKLGDGGFEAEIKVRGQDVIVDNRWVVPHNPLLTRMYNAHINVEICNSIKSIQYICKYINKGSDQACFGMEKQGAERDEVARYELGRYISSNEAIWRILQFPIHDRYPAVLKLNVHLPDGQRVYFTSDNVLARAETPPETTLTGFFKLCKSDDFAKGLLYCDVPRYYTWVVSHKKFKRRVQGTSVDDHPGVRKSDVLGRVYTVHPNQFQCFCLRLLLHEVRGPTCFEDLRTVDGVVYDTFQEAANKRGLLEDDAHWNDTLEEAAFVQSSGRLRTLFAVMLRSCEIADPKTLWTNHRDNMSADILMEARRANPDVDMTYSDVIYNQALVLLEDKVLELDGSDLTTYGLNAPMRNNENMLSRELIRQTNYDLSKLERLVRDNEPKLTHDQENVYSSMLAKIENKEGGIVFLDAPGGTGKTFLINLILAKIRLRRQIGLAVAFSGIAATLLDGGRTAHSTFKLPLNLTREESPTCNIKKGTGIANVLRECVIIVWDECTMMHKHGFEALDRTLQDVRENNKIMGGLLILLAGDFRQTLPIMTRGTPADEWKASLKSSYLWRSVKCLGLKTNMRVHIHGDESAADFARHVLAIGNDAVPRDAQGLITISPNVAVVVDSVDELISRVFPTLAAHFIQPSYHNWMCERAILAPKNVMATAVNEKLLEQLPGTKTTYKSIDKVCGDSHEVDYPAEFLHSLDPPGTPPHKLVLKVGAPIMLLRNLEAPKLCNGTRLLVKRLLPHLIEATIITGCAKGEDVFIPRIPIKPSDLAFEFKRIQFPIRLTFAMSINKAQGQSLKVAGIHLENPCFSHGQLYVACSRVSSANNLIVLAPDGKTVNVVYPKA